MIVRRRSVALALLLCVLAGPRPAPAAETPRRERLDNGFTVLVRENPLAPVVAVSLLVRMGTRWESVTNAGISNFLHAVMVKGTSKRSGAELADAIALMGGKISATGDVDYSGISGSALARFWRDLLALTAELALEPQLTAEDVRLERDWLLSRIQRQHDSPAINAFNIFYANLYGAHPYGQTVLGTAKSLERLDRGTLVAWYGEFYRPERMVLAVSGQVQSNEVLTEARRLFGGLPRGGTVAEPSHAQPVPAPHRIVVEQAAQQTQILAGGLAPSIDQRDHAAVKVLATVLGGGMAGRLFAELRDKQALAYTASAYYDPLREPGALILYLGTAPENATQAEAALLAQIERIRTQSVSAQELKRAKGYLLGNYLMDRRTNARLAWYMAFYEVEGVGQDFPTRYRSAVEAVTAEDVQRAARTYLAAPLLVILRPPATR